MNRTDLETYISEAYSVSGEHLFVRYPGFKVFRHLGNRRWFAVIMDIPRKNLGLDGADQINVVNLKCDTHLIGALRTDPGIFPGWHMNKAHWITVTLDGTVDDEKLKFLLNMSHELTR